MHADARVVVDHTVVTSRGPGTSMEWALCLVEQLYGVDHAKVRRCKLNPGQLRLISTLEIEVC